MESKALHAERNPNFIHEIPILEDMTTNPVYARSCVDKEVHGNETLKKGPNGGGSIKPRNPRDTVISIWIPKVLHYLFP